MLYDSLDPHRRQRIGAAALLAIFLHFTTLLILDRLFDLKLEREVKTIPVILIADHAIESQQSIQTQQQQSASAAQDFVTTQNLSQFSRTRATEAAPKGNIGMTGSAGRGQATELPRIDMPRQSQASRAQSAREGLQQIFNRDGAAAPIEQRSSEPERPQLSEYEQRLIRALSKDTLYDPFHQIILNRNLDRLRFSIEIQLFPMEQSNAQNFWRKVGYAKWMN